MAAEAERKGYQQAPPPLPPRPSSITYNGPPLSVESENSVS